MFQIFIGEGLKRSPGLLRDDPSFGSLLIAGVYNLPRPGSGDTALEAA